MHSLSAASAVRDSEGVTFETFLLDKDKAVEWGEQRILVKGRWHLSFGKVLLGAVLNGWICIQKYLVLCGHRN